MCRAPRLSRAASSPRGCCCSPSVSLCYAGVPRTAPRWRSGQSLASCRARRLRSRDARMNRITGRSAFLALLKDEGITHLFGNPGTTELPIMHALAEHPDLTFVLGLQEAIVVAMADGFSRASGRLVACNVHVAPGLGNAMGSLFNAKFTGTPMILTAGQQEQGHGQIGRASCRERV